MDITLKQIKSSEYFVDIADVRDGLFPYMRYALAQVQDMSDKNDGKFQKSYKIADRIAEEISVDSYDVYDCLVNATYPRCENPFIEGHGNMGFLPADMNFTEMRTSNIYRQIMTYNKFDDFNNPLYIPFPYVLSNGTIGYETSESKIPPHNLSDVIDALIALIKEPNIKTKELVQYIKGPDLPIGGEIVNKNELCDIYENGEGVIKVKITPETVKGFIEDVFDYCEWYDLDFQKIPHKEEWEISIPYNALLFDGENVKLMPLKDILQNWINFYLSVGEIANSNILCEKIKGNKNLSTVRRTKI